MLSTNSAFVCKSSPGALEDTIRPLRRGVGVDGMRWPGVPRLLDPGPERLPAPRPPVVLPPVPVPVPAPPGEDMLG